MNLCYNIMIRKLKTFDLRILPTEYAEEKPISYNKSFDHMMKNCSLYEFKDGSVPLFFNDYTSLPVYIIGEKSYVIKEKDIGRMDLIAWKYYSNPEYLWIICLLNDVDPLDMKAGNVLRLPPKDWIIFNILRTDI